MKTPTDDIELFDDSLPSAQPDEYVPVGLSGVLDATRKVLAMNRGITGADNRDGIQFKRVLTTADLLAETIQLDAGQALRRTMMHAARHKSLKGLAPGVLDDNIQTHLDGNPLSSPSEEVNPVDVLNQNRRVTLMGPGGISSADMVTADMQSVNASSFGFISPVEGPECFDARSQVYTRRGWVAWPDVLDSDVFACRINGTLEWHAASRIVREFYEGDMLVGENESIRMCVTPSHRVFCARDKHLRMEKASEVYGKTIHIPVTHEPEIGDAQLQYFVLPAVEVGASNQRLFSNLALGDWAEFLGWWLSEGSHSGNSASPLRPIRIHQDPVANPAKYARIHALLLRLGFITPKAATTRDSFSISAKQLCAYFSRWTRGCYDKWIPDECFTWPVAARKRLLEGLLLGDGRWNKKRIAYCTVSRRLADSVEHLAISLGFPAFVREERDARAHVTTTNYVVSISRAKSRTLKSTKHKHANGRVYGGYWSKQAYAGFVYCATVPGSLLLVRGKKGTAGFWSGNSERAGIDTRLSHGVMLGDNGRLYQKFRNPKTGNYHWLAPEDLIGKTVALPRPGA